jgi:hypothetical protein
VFIIDDLLASPGRGLMFILRKIDDAVREEMASDERSLMAELTALHRALDEAAITEADFEPREQALLERLDRLRGEDGADAGNSAAS